MMQQPGQNQQQPRPRLTIRELQERQHKAEQACIKAHRLVARWEEEDIIFIAIEQQVEVDDRAMARAMETIREGVCNSG